MSISDIKEKSFIIKVPVYSSELILKGNDLFGGVTFNDMIRYAKKKITEYQLQESKVSKNRRNKVQKKEIDNVECIDCKIGERPCALLKISAYNTNLLDGYLETDQKIKLKQEYKLGSDNYYLLLVPNIFGVNANDYKHQWIILVYEDPHKDTQEIIGTAKLVLNKILNISTSNIKLPEILEELKRIKNVPELSLNFTSLTNDDNEVDAKYRSYLVGSSFRKQKEDKFKNMPYKKTEEVINDFSYEKDYQKRIIKILVGKKEYRITRDQRIEAADKINEAVEEIYNESIGISETELNERIYEPSFIIEKLTPVLQNYLS
ncbi:MAG: hypothetical protein IPO21_02295 [Bacteroidales bacterium]|nr:hypothetical protein [Bacteroidales bacterium]